MQPDQTATPAETVSSLLEVGNRLPDGAVPFRREFVQQGTQSAPLPGPLAIFVRNGDVRGLDLYLMLKAVASSAPYNSHRSAPVWARALQHTGVTANEQTISNIWARLAERGLVTRSKFKRLADITLLREDGGGAPYTHPADDTTPRYFQLPVRYWLNVDEVWCATLSLPAKAMLLISLSLRDGFVMPVEKVPDWYGVSADSAQRGLAELERRGVLTHQRIAKKAPLAPDGYTYDRHFTLAGDFKQKWSRT